MRTRSRKALILAAALAAGSVTTLISAGTAAAVDADPTDVIAGAAPLSPASGTSTTTITLGLPVGQACPGDSAANGYRWHGFMVPLGTNLATLTFNASGPIGITNGFTLFTTTGSAWTNRTTSATAGLMTPLPSPGINFATAPIPDGAYSVGYACSKISGGVHRVQQFGTTLEASGAAVPAADQGDAAVWANTVTIGGGGTTYSVGAVPAAPTISSVDANSPAGDNAVVSFTAPAADPAITGYTVTATPQGGGAAITAPGAASPITVTGLTTGTTYDFTVVATNTAGNSAASAIVSATVGFDALPPVTGLNATAIPGGDVDVAWTAPASGPVPTGYLVALTPGGPSQTVTGTTATFTGLTPGTTYTVTVTPQHPSPLVADPATDTVTILAGSIIVQDLEVERPEGMLLFTQRCGVNDAIPAITAGAASPNGFKGGLGAITATADQDGTAPTDLNTGLADTNFSEYPYPIIETTGVANPNYVTACGVEFSVPRLVTETNDPYRGQFFRATALIDEITVVDTTDADAGWTLSASVDEFSDGAGQTFSGDYLGWQPVVSFDSGATPAIDGPAYDQTVLGGSSINPATPGGLSDGATLANAAAGAGLGISEHNARLMLLIPLTADAGTYTGTLTYTVA